MCGHLKEMISCLEKCGLAQEECALMKLMKKILNSSLQKNEANEAQIA